MGFDGLERGVWGSHLVPEVPSERLADDCFLLVYRLVVLSASSWRLREASKSSETIMSEWF
jgi:hypothetical protein